MTGREKPPMNDTAATEYALCLLDMRDYTEAGMREKLLKKGCDGELAAAVVKKLADRGLISDRSFAARFAEGHAGTKSRRQIGMALRQKGISEELCREAVEMFPAAEDEQIKKFLRGKGFPWEPADTYEEHLELQKRKQKLFAALSRRGYPVSAILRAMGEAEQFS